MRGITRLVATGLLLAGSALAASPTPPDAAVARLQADLRQIIARTGWSSAGWGVMAVSLERGDTLFSLNPDSRLAPASTLKLYTTAAALYYLGPDFRYSTYLLTTGPVRDGVLHGDLILYGTGDPGVSDRSIGDAGSAVEELADSLVALGVRQVRGDLVGDDSYFTGQHLGTGWNADDLLSWFAAPSGALSHDENMVSVRVEPGPGPGAPADITTDPDTRGLRLLNRVATVGSGRSLIRFEKTPEGLLVHGQIARGHPGVARTVAVGDPANYTVAAFAAALAERGVSVLGGLGTVSDPGESRVSFATGGAGAYTPPRVLAVHLSPPLAEIVRVTNHWSHNQFAESLLKTVGRVGLGEGSFRGGARAVSYFLECEAGVDSSWLRLLDGSGLSRLDQVTPRSTIHLLGYMAGDPNWEAFRESLPLAARSPRLRRMGGTAAAGNLRAKTGTIHEVSGLAGYVRAAGGETISFVILSNDVPSTWRAKRVEDAIGARLAEFTRPPPSEPEPAPEREDAPEEPAEPPVPEELPGARTHVVGPGDTFEGIARRYGVTVAEIERANPGVDPRRIQIGQEVAVPGARPAPPSADQARPADPDGEPRFHTVRSGDTLDGIARRYGVTVRQLRDANPGVDPARLQIGQEVRVP
ncbi:MAG: D-alanyl-D-alanine carboxypeptidase/D-alanyl-D-alanine endopeptidase [Longimicrobiaceae bacterium]